MTSQYNRIEATYDTSISMPMPPTCPRNSTAVTLEPSRDHTEPSSTPMTPAPMTINRFGTSLRESAPVDETIVCSSICNNNALWRHKELDQNSGNLWSTKLHSSLNNGEQMSLPGLQKLFLPPNIFTFFRIFNIRIIILVPLLGKLNGNESVVLK